MAILTPLLLLLKNYKSWKHVLTPGLCFSALLSALFLLFRKFPPLCSKMPSEDGEGDGCKFQWREAELYMCLMCVVMIKNRSAVSLQQMVETFLMYSKIVNTVLFFRIDPRFGFVYLLLCFVRIWIFPDIFTEESDDILHVDDTTLGEVLKEDPKVVWLVEFYTTWAPQCRAVAPVLTSLSKEYTTDYLRFAKIDIGRNPDSAKQYGVDTSTMSRQLPTLIVIKDLKPVNWRPMIGKNKKFIKYSFSEENIIRDFGLNALYEDSLKKGKKSKKKKAD